MKNQNGAVLLEGLIGILIFMLGLLGLAGFFVTSMKDASEAQYRSEATFLANAMIAEMRVADPDTRKSAYSASGVQYIKWLNRIEGDEIASGAASTDKGLPGATAHTVTFGDNNLVTVELNWKAKNDTSSRKYTVSAVLE